MADRALNMRLRVQGGEQVKRDFKEVGDAGKKAFDQIGKAAARAAGSTSQVAGSAATQLGEVADQAREASGELGNLDKVVKLLVPSTGGLGDKIGGVDGVLGKLSTRALGVTAVVAALGIVAIKSGAAFEESARQIGEFEAKLKSTGNFTGLTTDAIEEMTRQVSEAAGQSQEDVLAAANALAAVPSITAQIFQQALPIVVQWAHAIGDDVPAAVQRAAEAFSAIAGGDAKDMEQALKDISPAAREAVISLREAGDTAGAQKRYFQELAGVAHFNPDSVSAASQRLSVSWTNLLTRLGETTGVSSIAAGSLNALSGVLNWLEDRAGDVSKAWSDMLFSLSHSIPEDPRGAGGGGGGGGWGATPDEIAARNRAASDRQGNIVGVARMMGEEIRQQRTVSSEIEKQNRLLKFQQDLLKAGASQTEARNIAAHAGGLIQVKGPRASRTRSGGGGAGDEQAVANMLERAQEAAEAAAQRSEEAAARVMTSNQDVVDSYRQRAEEAQARLGKEGEALKAVERQQLIEAAARRIGTDYIERKVDAARAEAVQQALTSAARQKSTALMDDEIDRIKKSTEATFDDAAIRAQATAELERMRDALRRFAGEEIDATEAEREFTARMEARKRVIEQTRTPMEAAIEAVQRLREQLDEGGKDAEAFQRRVKQLAEGVVDAAHDSSSAWDGFGQDVSRTLTDILMHGGSALEILKKLVDLPLERMLQQGVGDPVARFVDKLTGTDRATNVGKTEAQLLAAPAQSAADGLAALAVQTRNAAQAMATIPGAAVDGVQDPLTLLGVSSGSAAAGMDAIAPATLNLGSAIEQALAALSGGGAGGGGGWTAWLQMGLKFASAAFGGAAGGNMNPFGAGGNVYGVSSSFADVGIYHGGGRVLPGGPTRRGGGLADEIAWRMAPRFHDGTLGLRHGEMRAILKKDEEVLTQSDAYALRRFLRGEMPRRRESASGPMLVQHNYFPNDRDPRTTASAVSGATQRGIARAARKGLAR